MISKIILLFVGCIGLILADSSCYISTNGTDSSVCSQTSPCRTISHCLSAGSGVVNISLASGIYGTENCNVKVDSENITPFTTINIAGPTLKSEGDALIICGNSTRQFWFSGYPFTTVSISNLYLSTGNGDNGGCIYAKNMGKFSIDNTYFSGCVAQFGGAVYSANTTMDISNSVFEQNFASFEGGALYLETLVNGTSIVSSSLVNNTAGLGAGIFLFGDYLTLTQSNISSNNATSYGGGLYILSPTRTKLGDYNFLGTNFTNNTATILGGGVYAENLNHTWNIFGALFVNNLATDLKGDSNIACNDTSIEFCYACTATDCVNDCVVDSTSSCSQNTTNTKQVLCYGNKFTSCSDSSCVCKTKMSKVEKILIVVICILLVVGVVLIVVDVVRYVLRKRQTSSYTPIK